MLKGDAAKAVPREKGREKTREPRGVMTDVVVTTVAVTAETAATSVVTQEEKEVTNNAASEESKIPPRSQRTYDR